MADGRLAGITVADGRLAGIMDTNSLPFDAKRMIYGGFEDLVKAQSAAHN